MNDSDAQKSISNLFGIIQGIIPYDKKLTNEEKLELIYTRELILQEKIEKALQEIHDFKILYVEQLALFSCENSPRYERLLKEIVKTLT